MHFEEGEDRSLLMFDERSRFSSIFGIFSSGALFSSLKSTVRRFNPRLILFVGVLASPSSDDEVSFCLGVRKDAMVGVPRIPFFGVLFSEDLMGV